LHISKIRYGGKSIHGGRPLSKAGKDVIPSYVTSIYIILNAMVNDIEKNAKFILVGWSLLITKVFGGFHERY
jgi:hypothetical protein